LFVVVLLVALVASVLVWNYGFLGSQNEIFESNVSIHEPSNYQQNADPDIPNEEPTHSMEPNLPTEPKPPTLPTEPAEPIEPEELDKPSEPNENPQQKPDVNPTNPTSEPLERARVKIAGEVYSFNPLIVNSTRPDLFNQGQFSMFDILVHLDEQNKIEFEYHFDESMNTHIIDSINGETDWWYVAYYDGGWPENNVFRADHYLWKPRTTLSFSRQSPVEISNICSEWKEEIERFEKNNRTIIIPDVIIRGESFTEVFRDVEVTAHNLRNDTLQENVITAIDVILSLADQGRITYELQWYDSIGSASIVRSYWIEAINGDRARGTCGFVYEEGSKRYPFFSGNHIHLPSDVRIINSPEYIEYFWICI
jgi:hypothetical protein